MAREHPFLGAHMNDKLLTETIELLGLLVDAGNELVAELVAAGVTKEAAEAVEHWLKLTRQERA